MREKLYTYAGITARLGLLCKLLGVNEGTIRRRMRLGMTIEEALETPIQKQGGARKRRPKEEPKKAAPIRKRKEVVFVRCGSSAGYYTEREVGEG